MKSLKHNCRGPFCRFLFLYPPGYALRLYHLSIVGTLVNRGGLKLATVPMPYILPVYRDAGATGQGGVVLHGLKISSLKLNYFLGQLT